MKRYNHINGVDNLIKIFSIKKYYCNDFKGRISYLLFAFLYLVKNYRLDLNFFHICAVLQFESCYNSSN